MAGQPAYFCMTTEEINQAIKESGDNTNLVSDGYHTFKELYDHRIALFIALCNVLAIVDFAEWGGVNLEVWKSRKHSDGSSLEGWFIAGIGVEEGEQITYHLPSRVWDELPIQELDKAPQFDGHTPEDVINRIGDLRHVYR